MKTLKLLVLIMLSLSFAGCSKSVKSKIITENEFRIIFDGDCPKESHDYTGKSDPMGTLLCGETYRIKYTQHNNEWVATGFNEGRKSIGTWKYKNANLDNNELSLWGRVFKFDNDLNVYDPQYGLVGHIYFNK